MDKETNRTDEEEIYSWCVDARDCLNNIVEFFDTNHIDEISDPRLENQVPIFARNVHELAVGAPNPVPNTLRLLMGKLSNSFIGLILAMHNSNLAEGMDENIQKDDQNANEIISDVHITPLYNQAKESAKILDMCVDNLSKENALKQEETGLVPNVEDAAVAAEEAASKAEEAVDAAETVRLRGDAADAGKAASKAGEAAKAAAKAAFRAEEVAEEAASSEDGE